MTQGGDVFVLDMGEPVKIINLAKRMINLSGLTPKDDDNPNGEIEIQFTGLRPGEKLHEELLIGSDTRPTAHHKITRAQEGFTRWAELSPLLEELQRLIEVNDVRRLYACVSVMVESTHLTVKSSTRPIWLQTENNRCLFLERCGY